MKRIILILTLFLLTPSWLGAELITEELFSDSEKKYNVFAKKRFMAVQEKLLHDLKSVDDMKKLNKINNWVNYIKYKSDKKVYGMSDYWATLYEFVGKGMGDCEDYTITKYYLLKELGIDIKRLKFTYVIYKDRRGKKISHMVLAYLKVAKPRKKSDILILDNNNRLILPASKRKDIVKVVKMINGDTSAKSKKWKKLEAGMKRKKL